MSRISINGISFDPAGPSIAAADAASPDTSKSNYILVQTTAPLSDADKTKLSELGVEIQEYVSENTYLCRYAPSDLTAVRALPFVSWAGVYLQGFKVNPSLRPPVSAAQTNAIGPLEAASSVSRTLRQVDIVAHDDVDPNSADFKAKVAAAAHVSPDTLTVNRRKIRLNVQEKFLNDVAAIDEVRHLEEVHRVKLYNNVAREIIGANVADQWHPVPGRRADRRRQRYRFRQRVDDEHPSCVYRSRGCPRADRPAGQRRRSGGSWHACMRIGAG